ncbi:MAG TPA: ATP-binding protein [Polyangiaceae bacterium]|nr:ATP-binding protein [Polyangiaceae bacterium]
MGELLVNPWIFVISAAVTLNLVVAGLALGVCSAPGWRDQRGLVVVAVAASGFSLGDLHTCIYPLPIHVRQIFAGLGLSSAALMVGGWTVYAARVRGRGLDRLDRSLLGVLLVTGLLTAVPGAAFTDMVFSRIVGRTGLIFWDVAPSPLGSAAFAALLGALFLLLIRQIHDYRRGLTYARFHTVALSLCGMAGVHDVLVSLQVINSVYLAEVGFVAGVFTLGVGLSRRFLAAAAELEELTRSLEARVVERTRELEETHEALAKAERLGAVGQLAAGVAHEINNPASAIQANLDYLRRSLPAEAGDPELRSAMLDASASIKRITRIVRQLLDLSRAAVREVPPNAVARLSDVVAASVETARATSDASARIDVRVADGLGVHAERYLLEQVLTNLIVNGVQAAKPGQEAHVRVDASVVGEHTVVHVTDNGVGMSDELRQRIGEPFFSTKPVGLGTGLGLAVSFSLVKNMGGTLSFESELGAGTKATLTLLSASEAGGETSSIRINTGSMQRMLMVDDDAVVLRSFTRMLGPLFQVSTAETVAEAKSSIATQDYDVIVCDVMMPDGGAPVLFDWLTRERPELARVTIFLTGGASSQEARDFLAQSTRPVLTKPFSINELVKVAREVTEGDAIVAER